MQWWKEVAKATIDGVFPPRCLICGGITARQSGVCADCWPLLNWLELPLCELCGMPFALPGQGVKEADTDQNSKRTCERCLLDPPGFGRARAVLDYSQAVRSILIPGLKYRDQTYAAQVYGQWMIRAGADLLAEAEYVIPVPIHRFRLFTRRYNQSAYLARAIAKRCRLSFEPQLLQKYRSTPAQTGLNYSSRKRNIHGAFRLRPRASEKILGRRIILVDDVLTTGATLSECARVLYQGGADRVDALVLARTTLDFTHSGIPDKPSGSQESEVIGQTIR